jgi:hypothetical protein
MESEKDGKTLISELDARWTNDESVVVFTWRGTDPVSDRQTSSTGLLGWDAARQIVVEHEIGADGSNFHGTHYISEEGDWISPYEGSTVVDGEPVFFESYRNINFVSGDKWTVTGTHLVSGEATKQHRIATFTRRIPVHATKTPTETNAKKVINALAGQWELAIVEDGDESTAKITAEESCSPLALRLTYQEPGAVPASGMFAWDATNKQLVETWFRGGEHIRICFNRMTDDGAFVGPGEGMVEDECFTGIRILKFHSPDHYTHTIRDNSSDGEPKPEVIITAKRMASTPTAR